MFYLKMFVNGESFGVIQILPQIEHNGPSYTEQYLEASVSNLNCNR